MGARKVKRASRPIVVGHLEKISSGIFERYPEQITGLKIDYLLFTIDGLRLKVEILPIRFRSLRQAQDRFAEGKQRLTTPRETWG